MAVENFFPEHYPWQRLLVNIAKAFEEEDNMITFVEIVSQEDQSLVMNMKASEVFSHMGESLVIGKITYLADNVPEEYVYFILVDAVYGNNAYTFYDHQNTEFCAATGDDYPTHSN